MGLELYSKIETYLDFQEEVYALHKEFLSFIFDKDLDNILDIGCGQGYFLENLLINNKNCFGIDLSKQQIEFCKAKGLTNVAAIALEDVEQKFDCATAIFDVINYLPMSTLKSFFKDANKVLNKDGYFIFDINTHFGFDAVAQGCITIDLGDKFVAIDANFEDEKLITDLTLFTKEEKFFKKESDSITQYFHEVDFLKTLLKEEGFKVEKINEFNLHGYEECDKLIIICKKI